MKLIDTHCHLDFDAFDKDRQLVINRAMEAGVEQFIVPGVTADKWTALMNYADEYHNVEYALGLHPYFVNQHQHADLLVLRELLTKAHAIAVGEIGLDFFDKTLDRLKQLYFFEAQIIIAQEFSLPIIVHARKSHDDVIRLLKSINFTHGGIMHAFNGSMQQAEQFMKLGFKLGFGGMLTYEKSSKLRALAKELPVEAIVLETDAPDMTGASHQGERNSPAYLPEVLQVLASLREQSAVSLAEKIYDNSVTVLGLRKTG